MDLVSLFILSFILRSVKIVPLTIFFSFSLNYGEGQVYLYGSIQNSTTFFLVLERILLMFEGYFTQRTDYFWYNKIIFKIMYVCFICTYVCIPCICLMPMTFRRGLNISAVIYYGTCYKSNSDPLQE